MAQSVIVLGAGIVGASVAFRLALAGCKVTLIDRGQPGALASARSFAWINANQPATADYYALRREAIDAWHRLGEILPEAAPLTQGGLTWEGGDWSPEAEIAKLNARGDYGARIVTRTEIARLEPALAQVPEAAVLTPLERAVDAANVALHLAQAAAGYGAHLLIGAEVSALLAEGGRVCGVTTDFGTHRADHVVIAGGAASGVLLAAAGVHLPMTARQGLILHTAPVARVLDHIVMTPEVHMRQERDGRIIAGEIFFGAGANAAMIAEDPAGLGALLLAALRRYLPGPADLQPLRLMLGLRPEPEDGFPAVGAIESLPGLSVAVMHSGVTLGPLIGELLAAEIAAERSSPLLAPYRPDRFAL
ncbi:FAD-binding oxidoreductase [Thioclava sp. BHET1]|nr:FAD-binding oxidoreductase [Thioclava sp. BHET1]